MVLSSVESERTDILETIEVDDVIIVVLNPEVLPNNDAQTTFNLNRYSAASEVAALWANVERCSTVGQVRRTLSQESGNACFLLVTIHPSERRYEIGIEPRRQPYSINHEVKETPLGATPSARSSHPNYV